MYIFYIKRQKPSELRQTWMRPKVCDNIISPFKKSQNICSKRSRLQTCNSCPIKRKDIQFLLEEGRYTASVLTTHKNSFFSPERTDGLKNIFCPQRINMQFLPWEHELTISVIRGSSGLGSAIKSCREVNTVLMLSDGLHAPYNKENERQHGNASCLRHGLFTGRPVNSFLFFSCFDKMMCDITQLWFTTEQCRTGMLHLLLLWLFSPQHQRIIHICQLSHPKTNKHIQNVKICAILWNAT